MSGDWAGFFSAQVGASAALTGLVVVAVSINLERVLALEAVTWRAAEALVTLVAALALSSLMLMPGQSGAARGVESLIVGLATLLAAAAIQWPHVRGQAYELRVKVIRAAVSAAASAPFIIGGALSLGGADQGPYWTAAGLILSLVSGVVSAWVLLVEIRR